jgi:hypothetical protein
MSNIPQSATRAYSNSNNNNNNNETPNNNTPARLVLFDSRFTPRSSLFGATESPVWLHASQLEEERDHKQCVDGHSRALVGDSLETLKQIAADLPLDAWRYAGANESASHYAHTGGQGW